VFGIRRPAEELEVLAAMYRIEDCEDYDLPVQLTEWKAIENTFVSDGKLYGDDLVFEGERSIEYNHVAISVPWLDRVYWAPVAPGSSRSGRITVQWDDVIISWK